MTAILPFYSARSHSAYNIFLQKYIEDSIAAGTLASGDRVPSENELARMFETSHITARRALSELVNKGKIYRVKGKGSFVSERKKQGDDLVFRCLMALDAQHDFSLLQMIQGAKQYFDAKGVGFQLDLVQADTRHHLDYLFALAESKSAGVMLWPIEPDQYIDAFYRLQEKGIPFVLLDRRTYSLQTNYSGSDNTAGAYMQVQHLAGLGHKRMAFIGQDPSLNTEKERASGFQLAVSDLLPGEQCYLFYASANVESEILPLIRSGEVTALVCVNDRTAVDCLGKLAQSGISVPEDVSIIGFDDWEPARYTQPALTTIRQDFPEIGCQAAKLLWNSARHKGRGVKTVLQSVSLVVRESTAQPR